MISTVWKQEFRVEQFWLEYSRPSEFTRSQWQRRGGVSVPYLAYRWLLATYFFCSIVTCFVENSKDASFRARLPIYLSNWGYLLHTAQTLLAACIVTDKARKERAKDYTVEPNELQMPGLYKLYWLLHTLSVVLAFGITICFWVAVSYNYENISLDLFSMISHGANAIVIGLDFFLVGHPFRLFHCVWPVLYVAVYIVFSAVYFAFGGTDQYNNPFIYSVLDWEHVGRTMAVSGVGLLFVFGLHCASWALYLVRRAVAACCGRGRPDADRAEKGFENSVSCSESFTQLEVD